MYRSLPACNRNAAGVWTAGALDLQSLDQRLLQALQRQRGPAHQLQILRPENVRRRRRTLCLHIAQLATQTFNTIGTPWIIILNTAGTHIVNA